MIGLKSLLDRQMDRREFLLYLGFFFLTITGISGLLKNLTNPRLLGVKNTKPIKGFGYGTYGGPTKKETS